MAGGLLTDRALAPGETLVVQADARSTDGERVLRDVYGRFVRVQLLGRNTLGNGQLAIADIRVIESDNTDLVRSDGDVRRDTDLWQVAFANTMTIGELTLHNRDTADFEELSNFRVSILDRDSASGRVLWAKDYFPTGSVQRGGSFVIRELEAAGVDSAAGAFPYVNFAATVEDGELNITFDDGGRVDRNWVPTRMSLRRN